MVRGVRSALLRYGFAIFVFGVILSIAALLSYLSIQTNNLIPIVAGLVITAWYGGRGPGILLAGMIVATTIFTNPLPSDISISRQAFQHFSVLALLVFIVVLISGRKSAEKRLRHQSDLFRITLSSIGDAVIATDKDGKVTFLNPTAERLTAWTAEEAKGRSLDEIYNVAEETSGKPIGEVFKTIKEKREIIVFDTNTVLINREERSIPINDSGAPILDSQNNFIGAVIVFQDVTERRLAEQALIDSETRLMQSQKLEAIGTLTGGVAHDFNNLLTAILGYTQLSMRRLDPHHPIRENLVNVEKAGNRGAELTKKLLAFSRRQHLDRRVMDLNDSIAEVLKLLERVIGEDVKVSFTAADNLSAVSADAAQIEQVIMNLSLNARDAMPTGGRLAIETRNVELDQYYCRQYPNCVPGKYAQILVSDTGTGMDTETLKHIFEPFFTTKEVNKGTGLGLSMVYGIVTQHGGLINVYSEPGHGTTFKIFLPVVDSSVEKDKHVVQPSLLGGTETILVAEDEEALRNLSKDVLEALGYTVLSAQNGEEAVELFAANRDKIDLLLFDVVMPVMGGSEAYKTIREMDGKVVPLIFMTGYSSEVLDSPYVKQNQSIDLASVHIIQKPYTLDALGRAVRDTLDKP
jgi:two-component system, cell cycle sensor histidine kinase and response regulator CckA